MKKIVTMGEMCERTAAQIMRQLLSAVVYCHSLNIVHRYMKLVTFSDLKPENLVLETKELESNLKVIDFGTSKLFEKKEIMHELLGTV